MLPSRTHLTTLYYHNTVLAVRTLSVFRRGQGEVRRRKGYNFRSRTLFDIFRRHGSYPHPPSSRTCITIFLFLLTGLRISAQHTDTIYFDKGWKVSQRQNHSYYRLLSYDQQGQLVQPIHDYFAGGHLQFSGTLIMGGTPGYEKMNGPSTWYHPNWKVQSIQQFKNGKKDGRGEEYNDRGSVLYRYQMSADSLDGDFFAWSAEEHYLQYHNHYKDGKKDGIQQAYHTNGIVSELIYFKNGKVDSAIAYTEAGDLQSRSIYTGHIHRQESYSYFPSGELSFYQDERDSPTIFKSYPLDPHDIQDYRTKDSVVNFDHSHRIINIYDIQKHRSTSFNYICDYLEGIAFEDSQIHYHANGAISSRAISRSGGEEFTDYYCDGKISSHAIHANGLLCDSAWDSKGVLLEYLRDSFNLRHLLSRSVVYYDYAGREIMHLDPRHTRYTIGKDNATCLYGLLDRNGHWAVAPAYAQLSYDASSYYAPDSNFMIGVIGGRKSLIDAFGKVILPPVYDEIKQPEGSVTVLNGPFGTHYVSDFSYQGDYDDYRPLVPLHRFLLVERDGLMGMADITGRIVIPVIYDLLFASGRNTLVAWSHGAFSLLAYDGSPVSLGLTDAKTKLTLLNVDDKMRMDSVILFEYATPSQVRGRGLHWQSGKELLANSILSSPYDFCAHTGGASFIASTDSTVLFLEATGHLLSMLHGVSKNIGRVESDDESYFIFSLDGKYGVANSKGETVIPFVYDRINFLRVIDHEYYVVAIRDSVAHLFDPHFRDITPALCSSIALYSGHFTSLFTYPLFMLGHHGMQGLSDHTGHLLLPVRYSYLRLHSFQDRSVVVSWLDGDTLRCASAFHMSARLPVTAIASDGGTGIYLITPLLHPDGYDVLHSADARTIVVNAKGKLLAPLTATDIHVIGRLVTYAVDSQYYQADASGATQKHAIAFTPRDQPVSGFTIVETPSGRLGVIDANMRLVLDTAYFIIALSEAGENRIWAQKNFPPLPHDPDSVSSEQEAEEGSYALGRDDANIHDLGFVLYDTTGRALLRDTFFSPVCFSTGSPDVEVLQARTGSGTGLLTTLPDWLIPPAYTSFSVDTPYGYFARASDHTDFYDLSGHLLAAGLQNVSPWYHGYFIATHSDGTYGLIESSGHSVIPFAKDAFVRYNGDILDLIPSMMPRAEVIDSDGEAHPLVDKKVQQLWDNLTAQTCYLNNILSSPQENNSTNLEQGCTLTVSSLEYRQEREVRYCSEDSEYSHPTTIFADQHILSFSVDATYNYSCTRGMGSSSMYTLFFNYYLKGTTPTLFLLSDYITTEAQKIAINNLLRKKILLNTDPDTDCKNIENLYELAQYSYSLDNKTLTFYIPTHPSNTFGDHNFISLTFTRPELTTALHYDLWSKLK